MRLHVNIDHVATVRQARGADEPDPVRAAVLAEMGGADGITVHLREDRRHIQDRDVRLLMQTVRTGVNLELATSGDVVAITLELHPMAATLVPEKREEVTTEGGLQVQDNRALADVVKQLLAKKIRTALFIDPDPDAVRASAQLGVDAIELHTGEFAEAYKRLHHGGHEQISLELARLHNAADLGRSLGLAVHAGHGLTYGNVALVAAIDEIEELNIGHSIVSRAVFTGMETAVRDMKEIIIQARANAHTT